MEIIHPAVAGIDVHKKQVTVTVLTPAATSEGYTATVKVFRAFWRSLQQLAAWLIALGVRHAAMEATGVYWWPVYHALTATGAIEVCVANAAHMRNLPGRKTDVRDSQWIAEIRRPRTERPRKPARERRMAADTAGRRELVQHPIQAADQLVALHNPRGGRGVAPGGHLISEAPHVAGRRGYRSGPDEPFPVRARHVAGIPLPGRRRYDSRGHQVRHGMGRIASFSEGAGHSGSHPRIRGASGRLHVRGDHLVGSKGSPLLLTRIFHRSAVDRRDRAASVLRR